MCLSQYNPYAEKTLKKNVQTFVVLYLPGVPVVRGLLPLLELRERVEALEDAPLARLQHRKEVQ
jgi:hypothetical protein